MDVSGILSELGYQLTEDGEYYRCAALYRNGDNSTALRVHRSSGKWCDWVTSTYGPLEDLIKLTLGHKDINETKQWLENKNINISEVEEQKEQKIKSPKIFDEQDVFSDFIEDYSYWNQRGISSELLKELKNGVKTAGKMKNRSIFAIRNEKNQIIGLNGRSLDPKHKIRWKFLGEKKVVFPIHYSDKYIKESKSVILVESVGNFLSLVEMGKKNVLVTFGTSLSFEIVNYLLRIDIQKICISLDNDIDSAQNWGMIAAQKMQNKLSRYFDRKIINIKTVPLPHKDWNDYLLAKISSKSS